MVAEQTLGDWQVTCTAPGAVVDPTGLVGVLDWVDAPCPGTAASAWRDAGRWSVDGPDLDFDAFDWWFRTSFDMPSDQPAVVHFGGIATIADVWVDGQHTLHSENMFVSHDLPVPPGSHELVVVCRSLEGWLAKRRPRGAWKTRLVAQQQLRWVRTTLLGRMPTWPPRAAPVGLWRPVEIIRSRRSDPFSVRVRAKLDDARDDAREDDGGVDGTVNVLAMWAPGHGIVSASIRGAGVEAVGQIDLDPSGACTVSASLAVTAPVRWWPATHGEPVLHDIEIELTLDDGAHVTVPAGRIGFRTITADRSDGGFRLVVNDVPIFARGACWVPIDPVAVGTTRQAIAHALGQVVAGGMNMVRLTGTMVYEQREFYEVCDELGVLVWQDLMFANMDLPIDDEGFAASVDAEVGEFLDGVAAHPCLAVVCGGSEVEQQAAMMGLDPADVPHRLGREVLAGLAAEFVPDIVYVDNSPSGGVFPFSVSSGISHYYGVGAYRRPLDDARRANVRFTSECLAFANVPTRQSIEPFLDSGDRPGHSPRWKQAVPRDRSAGWDFEDVRDHYVARFFGVDPVDVRWADPERYLDLGRAATAIAIESTLSEWRRPGSGCAGALLFTLRDLVLGAGWGIVDSTGRTKSAYAAAARASAPQAVLLTDEGLNGLAAHLVNDGPGPAAATLVARLFDASGVETATATTDVDLPAHGGTSLSVDAMFGGFRDLTYAYRFGPLAVDVIALEWHDRSGALVADSVYLPGGHGRPLLATVGIAAHATRSSGGDVVVRVRTEQFAQFVSVEVAGHDADRNWFHLAPGAERTVRLAAVPGHSVRGANTVEVRALNSRTVVSAPIADVAP